MMTPQKLDAARKLHADGMSAGAIADVLKVGRTTVYRHLQDPAEAAGSEGAPAPLARNLVVLRGT